MAHRRLRYRLRPSRHRRQQYCRRRRLRRHRIHRHTHISRCQRPNHIGPPAVSLSEKPLPPPPDSNRHRNEDPDTRHQLRIQTLIPKGFPWCEFYIRAWGPSDLCEEIRRDRQCCSSPCTHRRRREAANNPLVSCRSDQDGHTHMYAGHRLFDLTAME
jgi:hypothetical protein